MDTSTRLAQLLRDLRGSRMLTQREVAYLSGVDQRRISSYERGSRKIPLRDADRILTGLGLQLRLETEQLWAGIDARIDELANVPIAARLTSARVMIIDVLRWLAAAEPVVDGRAAALLQGAPVPVEWLDLRVRRDKLDTLADAMMKWPPDRWYEPKQWWDRIDIDPRLPGAMRWRSHFGQIRIGLSDDDPQTIAIVVDDEVHGESVLRVRPLADIEVEDPETARVLERLRDRRAAARDGGAT